MTMSSSANANERFLSKCTSPPTQDCGTLAHKKQRRRSTAEQKQKQKVYNTGVVSTTTPPVASPPLICALPNHVACCTARERWRALCSAHITYRSASLSNQ